MTEAVDVVVRVAANHGDEGKKHEPDDQQDFGRGHDELALSVPFHGDDVEDNANDHCHCDPHCRVDASCPILHNRCNGRVFDTDQHHAGVEVHPPPGPVRAAHIIE